MKGGGSPPSFEGFIMQKEFAQFVFSSNNDEELFSFSTAVTDLKLPNTVRVVQTPGAIRLISGDIESLVTLYENFKGEEQFSLEPIVYLTPSQPMAHGGLAVEAGEVVTGFDVWLEVSPSEVFDNEIEHNYPVDYDAVMVEQQIRKLFSMSPFIEDSVCRTKVKILSFEQDGEPSRETLTSALRGAFEGALNKATPVEITALLSVSLSVVERQFDSANALFSSLGGEVTAVDMTGRLKKVNGVLPVGVVLEQYSRFVNITKDGELGFELKDFVAVSK